MKGGEKCEQKSDGQWKNDSGQQCSLQIHDLFKEINFSEEGAVDQFIHFCIDIALNGYETTKPLLESQNLLFNTYFDMINVIKFYKDKHYTYYNIVGGTRNRVRPVNIPHEYIQTTNNAPIQATHVLPQNSTIINHVGNPQNGVYFVPPHIPRNQTPTTYVYMTQEQLDRVNAANLEHRLRQEQRRDEDLATAEAAGVAAGWCCMLGIGILQILSAVGSIMRGGNNALALNLPPSFKKTLYVRIDKNEFITLNKYLKSQEKKKTESKQKKVKMKLK